MYIILASAKCDTEQAITLVPSKCDAESGVYLVFYYQLKVMPKGRITSIFIIT